MADVFDAGNGVPANFHDGTVELVINGTVKGRKTTVAGESLGAFLKRQAQSYGVRTFSAYADGRKLTTESAAGAIGAIKSVEIVAKDARGKRGEFNVTKMSA